MTDSEMRELDAWIAEHVLGKKVTGGHSDVLVNTLYESADHPMLPPQQLRKYTSDPAAAMLVLEKCIERGSTPLLSRAFHSDERAELFTVRDGELGDMYAIGETLPLAICLFAKKLFV